MKESSGLRFMRSLTNRYVRDVLDRLDKSYGRAHPGAAIEAYAPEPGIIRIRITDPGFEGQSSEAREDAIWPILESMGQDFLQELHVLVLVTPRERKRSPASLLFDGDLRRPVKHNHRPNGKAAR